MTRARRVIVLLCALAVAPVLHGNARAEDAEAGRRLFKRGQDLLKANDYRAAARAFEQGYAAAPRVGFLLNIGNCYRKLGELSKAREFYWRFLDAAPKDHPSRPAVMDYLRAMEQIEADGVSVDAASGAHPPARPAGTAAPRLAQIPPPPAWQPTPGPAPGLMVVDERPAPAPRPLYKRWWFWTAIGGLVAAGATAYVLTRPAPVSPCGASFGCPSE
jgi:tetratricopeptide (TPR) repeat protein